MENKFDPKELLSGLISAVLLALSTGLIINIVLMLIGKASGIQTSIYLKYGVIAAFVIWELSRVLKCFAGTYTAMQKALDGLPTPENAEQMGIHGPLDYCIYQATSEVTFHQVRAYFPDRDAYRDPDALEFGPRKDSIFREIYGREPLDTSEGWVKAMIAEAAAAASIRPEDVTIAIINQYASEEMKGRVTSLEYTAFQQKMQQLSD